MWLWILMKLFLMIYRIDCLWKENLSLQRLCLITIKMVFSNNWYSHVSNWLFLQLLYRNITRIRLCSITGIAAMVGRHVTGMLDASQEVIIRYSTHSLPLIHARAVISYDRLLSYKHATCTMFPCTLCKVLHIYNSKRKLSYFNIDTSTRMTQMQ